MVGSQASMSTTGIVQTGRESRELLHVLFGSPPSMSTSSQIVFVLRSIVVDKSGCLQSFESKVTLLVLFFTVDTKFETWQIYLIENRTACVPFL